MFVVTRERVQQWLGDYCYFVFNVKNLVSSSISKYKCNIRFEQNFTLFSEC